MNRQATRHEPIAGLATLQTPRPTLETLREQQPGHRIQIDAKFMDPLPGTRKSTTNTPPSTTALACRSCASTRRTTRRPRSEFIDYVAQRLPFTIDTIQNDNGAEFQSSFHWHVLDKGMPHVYIKPRTPRLNGKVGRSHRIDAEEFYRLLGGDAIDDARVINDKLRDWEDYYNYHRPHGGLDGQTPHERLCQKITDSGVTDQRQPYNGEAPPVSSRRQRGTSVCRSPIPLG